MGIKARNAALAYPLEAPAFPPGLSAEDWQMVTRRTLIGLGIAGGAVVAAAGAAGLAFSSAIGTATAHLGEHRSKVIATSFGDLEYAEAGAGRPLLMIHGAGGGYDQGLYFAAPLIEAGYRVIAPSRFGYLRSALPAEATSEKQADAYVELLDALQLDRVIVTGGSAGGLSAVQFAIRHPDRCAALIAVVPIGHANDRPPGAAMPSYVEAFMQAVLHSDFLFWSLAAAAPDSLVGSLLATDPALVHAADPAERARVYDTLWRILPVSGRSPGVVNDTDLAMHTYPLPLDRIAAPTLAISCDDDRFGTAAVARTIAAGVTGARLITYPTGGHLYVGHQAEMFTAITSFLSEIAAP